MNEYKFVSWNVNGIRAVDRKEALKWIDEDNIDILSVQETKAQDNEIPDSIFDRQYENLVISSSAVKGRYGVALFTDLDLEFSGKCKEVDILDEGRINEVHFSLGDKKIAYFNVYFPNGKSKEERLKYKMEFYERFLIYLENLKKEGFSIIVCGDVNTAHREIDLARPKANEKISGFLPMEREWIDKFLSYGYIDTFRHMNKDVIDKYSWWSYRANARANNVGWRIDYFYVSKDLENNVIDAYILNEIEGSDHCPIVLELEF